MNVENKLTIGGLLTPVSGSSFRSSESFLSPQVHSGDQVEAAPKKLRALILTEEGGRSPMSEGLEGGFSQETKTMGGSRRDEMDMEEIREIFNKFDSSHNGKLSQDDLARAVENLGERIEPEELDEMMKLADFDGDGFISFEDFLQLLSIC
jgi:hypothetical protein